MMKMKILCCAFLALLLLVPSAYANDAGTPEAPAKRGFRAAIKRAAKKAAAAAKKAAAKTKAAVKKAAAKTKAVVKKAAAKTKAAVKKAAAKTKAAVKKAATKTKAAAKKAAAKTKAVAKKAVAKTKAAAKKTGVALKKAAAKTKAAVKKAVNKVKAVVRRPAPAPAAPSTQVAVPAASGEVTQVAQPKTTLTAPAGSVFASILNSGKVRVCIRTDIPPFGYFHGRTIRGFDITLAKKIVAGISIRYNKSLKIRWTVINAKARVPSLQQGRCDLVAASFSKTAKRAKLVAFSDTYLRTHKVLIASQKITRTRPILAVVKGTTTPTSAVPGAQVTEFFNYNEILDAMRGGYVDYVLSDHPTATFLVKKSTGFKVQKVLAQQENYGIGMHLHHTNLHKEVNAVLGYLARSGHIAYFKRRWIK